MSIGGAPPPGAVARALVRSAQNGPGFIDYSVRTERSGHSLRASHLNLASFTDSITRRVPAPTTVVRVPRASFDILSTEQTESAGRTRGRR